jgi:hypothetical protein
MEINKTFMIQFYKNDIIEHHGVKGQKWGVVTKKKPTSSSNKKLIQTDEDAAKKSKARKKVAGLALGITLAAGTAIYLLNKNKIDKSIGNFFDRSATKRAAKDAAYAASHRSSIFNSPSKLKKYRRFFSADDVDNAIKNLQRDSVLGNLSNTKIKQGSEKIASILGYAAVATTAYNLKDSKIVQDIKGKVNNKK